MIDQYCAKCYYRAFFPALGWGCEYICVTGKRRPCPSGEGCTVRKIKSRVGTKNAEERRGILFAKEKGMEYDQLKEERRQKRLERKREYNREYSQRLREERGEKPKPQKKIGAADRKKITKENTRNYWQGKQAEAIKAWKAEQGISYEQMAELCEVGTTTIYKWVNEENTANWDTLEALGVKMPVVAIDKSQNNDKI